MHLLDQFAELATEGDDLALMDSDPLVAVVFEQIGQKPEKSIVVSLSET